MKYRSIVVSHYGGPEEMQIVEDELPEPRRGEVRVKILVAGVGFTDILMREGTYPGGPRPPFTPGWDMVGTVDNCGEGVKAAKLGQMVASLTVWGSYAEFICLPEQELIPVPENLDPAEAVCLVFIYMTAYQLLHRTARVKSGERLLVHGAGGGVGTAIPQLGRLEGLQMYGTASGSKSDIIARLNAIPIDYKHEDFVTRIFSLTSNGVDVVLDGIGGPISLRSYRVLRKGGGGGRLVLYGHYSTLVGGRKNVYNLFLFYASGALALLANILPIKRRVLTYRITKLKARHPEKTSVLVLTSAVVHKEPPMQFMDNVILNGFFKSDFAFWLIGKYFQPQLLSFLGTTPEAQAKLTSEEKSWISDTFIPSMNPISQHQPGMLNDRINFILINYSLGQIDLPTLVIQAKDDTLVNPSHSLYAAEKIPNAKHIEFDSGGHVLLGHHQDTKSAIIDFLTQNKIITEKSVQAQ
jgi:NADPH2:quinone reductase